MTRQGFIHKIMYGISILLFVMTTIAGWFGADADCIFMKFDLLGKQQEITGWGTSACWWSQIAGDSENAEEIAKLIYSEEGLGLNIYRYNVGAGEKDNPNTRLPGNEWRATESFLVYNEAEDKYEYDWTKDAAAQKMLELSLSYGCVDTVVLFANSPHYSMTVSGSAAGGFEPAQSNLRKDCYDDFAEYMCDIAEYFIAKGVPVKYISPVNEPQWDWGGGWVGQEGCHYEINEVIELAKVFAAEIKERGLDVKLSLAESGQVGDHAMDCIDEIYKNQDIVDVLGTYAYHSYWTNDFLLKKAYGEYIKKNYPCVELEMSEWCELPNEHVIDDIDAGLIMARTISEDVTMTGVNSWSSWVAVNDGLYNADSMIGANADCSEYVIGKRYYAMAHFSKFIPAGSHMVDFDLSIADVTAEKAWWKDTVDGKEYDHYIVENKMNVSAYKTPDGDYVAVIVNNGGEKKINFAMLGYDMSVYTTDATRELELTKEGNGIGSINVGEKSITTVVFSK
ncbi:MAG: glycoside hydrolase [Acutalibacteraceae bacterium]|nr:glycoside hydrolase [Acutalibacteraceae bacterium]